MVYVYVINQSTSDTLPCEGPYIITANGDGINDVLVLGCLDDYPNHEVIIMNRWGDVVYRTQSYNNNWNGQSNTGLIISGDKVTPGVYFYVINFGDGVTPPIKSYVVLEY
jgi:gliding motility-associated-like protein